MPQKEKNEFKLPAKRKHQQVSQDQPIAAVSSSSPSALGVVKKPRLHTTHSYHLNPPVITANGASQCAELPSSDSTLSGPPSLEKQYNLHSLSVLSSSKIRTRVTQTLAILSPPLAAQDSKDNLVLLHARPNAASKLISIVEILKRELSGSTSEQWFQYNVLEKKLAEKTTSRPNEGSPDEDKNVTNSAEEIVFEAMKMPYEKSAERMPKIKADIILKIYLSRVRIESLKKIYGEQTNKL